jgi:integrase
MRAQLAKLRASYAAVTLDARPRRLPQTAAKKAKEKLRTEIAQAKARLVSRDEEKRLLECASIVGWRQGNWTPLYTVTVLGLNTGMRHKEIRKLKWKNLDLENRVLKVGESKTEAGKGRPVPLTQPAWAALDVWASRSPNRRVEHFVFPAWENGHIDPERPIAAWRTAWRRACREAEIKGLRFHDLRHTAATSCLSKERLLPLWLIFSDGLQAQPYAWQRVTDTSGQRCNGKRLRR